MSINNLKSGHSHQHTIKFPDPVLSVMDRYVFTLKQVLKCWDRHTMELQWQYPPVGSSSLEKLIPLSKMDQYILCFNRTFFRVLSLDRGKLYASTDVSLYHSIFQIGERIFLKNDNGFAFEFFWKENRMAELPRDHQMQKMMNPNYLLMRKQLADLGFSINEWLTYNVPLRSFYRLDTIKQLETIGFENAGFAVFEDKVFVISMKNVSVSSEIIYTITDPQKTLDKIFVQDGFLILEIIDDRSKRSIIILDCKSYEEIKTFDLPNINYTETDYAGRQTHSSRSLYFENGCHFQFFGSYLQVSDFKHLCRDAETHNHPLYTITDSGLKIGSIEDTDDLNSEDDVNSLDSFGNDIYDYIDVMEEYDSE